MSWRAKKIQCFLLYLINFVNSSVYIFSVEWLIVDESDKLFEEGKTGFRDQVGVRAQHRSKNLRTGWKILQIASVIDHKCSFSWQLFTKRVTPQTFDGQCSVRPFLTKWRNGAKWIWTTLYKFTLEQGTSEKYVFRSTRVLRVLAGWTCASFLTGMPQRKQLSKNYCTLETNMESWLLFEISFERLVLQFAEDKKHNFQLKVVQFISFNCFFPGAPTTNVNFCSVKGKSERVVSRANLRRNQRWRHPCRQNPNSGASLLIITWETLGGKTHPSDTYGSHRSCWWLVRNIGRHWFVFSCRGTTWWKAFGQVRFGCSSARSSWVAESTSRESTSSSTSTSQQVPSVTFIE